MVADIFEFWSVVGSTDRVHPADREILSRIRHDFDLRCLPGCFVGPLRTARVVLLFASPGRSEEIDVREAASEAVQMFYERQRGGDQPLPGPEEAAGWFQWWRRTTGVFGDWRSLRDRIAILDLGAYKSRTTPNALMELPSSQVSLCWAHRVLFPQARAGERVVICLRAHKQWRIPANAEPYGRSLFSPRVTRRGDMVRDETRDRALAAVDDVLRRSG
jgi:hypothetical protein